MATCFVKCFFLILLNISKYICSHLLQVYRFLVGWGTEEAESRVQTRSAGRRHLCASGRRTGRLLLPGGSSFLRPPGSVSRGRRCRSPELGRVHAKPVEPTRRPWPTRRRRAGTSGSQAGRTRGAERLCVGGRMRVRACVGGLLRRPKAPGSRPAAWEPWSGVSGPRAGRGPGVPGGTEVGRAPAVCPAVGGESFVVGPRPSGVRAHDPAGLAPLGLRACACRAEARRAGVAGERAAGGAWARRAPLRGCSQARSLVPGGPRHRGGVGAAGAR